MNQHNKIDDFINANPKICLSLLFIAFLMAWQTLACLLGILVFIFLKKHPFPIWFIILLSLVLIGFELFFSQISFALFIKNGFYFNGKFLHNLLSNNYATAWKIFSEQLFVHTFCLPFLIAQGLNAIGLIQNPPHAEALKSLQRGQLNTKREELTDEEIKKRLTKINDHAFDGVVLGVSTYTGLPLVIPDYYINQVALVLGTTGSGKTITLRRFYQRAIQKNYPLIIVDGKPDDANIAWLTRLAEKYQRKFYGFNCANYYHYDPLAKGGHTELKDKIISLKDQWENDYYRSIAEDYLQTTFEVLLASKQSLYLKTVVDCLNFDELQTITRSLKSEKLSKRVESLAQYNRADITGLQAHLNILIHSELGKYFDEGENSFNLSQIIADNGIVYFALPALRFPSFSKVLGKLVINDIKAVIDCINNKDKKIFTIFDEFSVFAGEQVLNLVNMGRGKGVHAIFGTQGLADLDRVDNIFKNQVLNCVNTLICHRLNDGESAEGVANWIATEDTFNVTAQLNLRESDGGMGSVKVHKEYIVHPDEIKKGLRVGEAFYVSKVDGFNKNKVRVKF